jgi:uncharacterized protein with PIN domain
MSAAVMDERTPRFLVDRTVGRLARWLRLLGYDAVWEPTDDLAGLLALAESEKRVLLTRDTLLIERRPVRHGDVKAVRAPRRPREEQLRQLRVEIGLRPQGSSRCLICNAALERLTAEQARLRVPPTWPRRRPSFTTVRSATASRGLRPIGRMHRECCGRRGSCRIASLGPGPRLPQRPQLDDGRLIPTAGDTCSF